MTSRAFSTLAILFLLFDSVMHLLRPAPVVEAFASLGFPMSTAGGLYLRSAQVRAIWMGRP